jgi:thioredoxin 1
MATKALKSAELEQTLDTRGVVLFDCWAAWCAPCRVFGPIYERVSELHPDVTFTKVDVEAEPEIARAFQVTAIPTLIVFRDGVPLYSQAGALREAELDALVKEAKALDMDDVRRQIAEAEKDALAEGPPAPGDAP